MKKPIAELMQEAQAVIEREREKLAAQAAGDPPSLLDEGQNPDDPIDDAAPAEAEDAPVASTPPPPATTAPVPPAQAAAGTGFAWRVAAVVAGLLALAAVPVAVVFTLSEPARSYVVASACLGVWTLLCLWLGRQSAGRAPAIANPLAGLSAADILNWLKDGRTPESGQGGGLSESELAARTREMQQQYPGFGAP